MFNKKLAKEAVKVLAFSPPLWKRGGGGRFYYKNKTFNINVLCFYKIPLYPPFPKREVKNGILSQPLKHCAPNNLISLLNGIVLLLPPPKKKYPQ